jgi:hypothetical protein
MPQPISETKGLLFTPAFDTYVPALGESANIQDALELFYYGNSTNGNTIDGTDSIYANLVDFDNRINAIDTSTHVLATAAHGATGAVVGTTNEQILTNKTLTTPKINEDVTLTATSTELNVLDGITASTAELNYVDGVTSAIQTQINLKPTLRYEGTILNRNIFVQAAQPTAVNIGDIWIDF